MSKSLRAYYPTDDCPDKCDCSPSRAADAIANTDYAGRVFSTNVNKLARRRTSLRLFDDTDVTWWPRQSMPARRLLVSWPPRFDARYVPGKRPAFSTIVCVPIDKDLTAEEAAAAIVGGSSAVYGTRDAGKTTGPHAPMLPFPPSTAAFDAFASVHAVGDVLHAVPATAYRIMAAVGGPASFRTDNIAPLVDALFTPSPCKFTEPLNGVVVVYVDTSLLVNGISAYEHAMFTARDNGGGKAHTKAGKAPETAAAAANGTAAPDSRDGTEVVVATGPASTKKKKKKRPAKAAKPAAAEPDAAAPAAPAPKKKSTKRRKKALPAVAPVFDESDEE